MIRFTLFDTQIRVQPWFFLTAYFIGPRGTEPILVAMWIAVVFFGVLAHELGHAFAGRRFGLSPYIELYAFGGLTGWRFDRPLTPVQRIIISAAGPGVGIAIGVVCLVILNAMEAGGGGLQARFLLYLVWVNLGWGLLNLLPILPLDGGHIAASLAELAWKERGRRVARIFSLVVTVSLALWALSTGQLWLTILGGLLTAINWQALQQEGRRRIRPTRSSAQVQEELQQLGAAFNRTDWPEVETAAEGLVQSADGDDVRAHALYYLAWARLMLGKTEAARAVVEDLPAEILPRPGLTGSLLLEEGQVEAAFPHLAEAVARGAESFVVARWLDATRRLGRFAEATELLRGPGGKILDVETLASLEEGAYDGGHFAAAAQFAATAFKRGRDPLAAYNAACSFARAGRTDEALSWLGRALRSGYSDLGKLDSDPDLEALRPLPEYQELRARLVGT